MIPRYRTELKITEAFASLYQSGNVSVESFEAEFARIYGFKHAVFFSYGRQAIRCYLENLLTQRSYSKGVGAVLSPFNCVALGNALSLSGYQPVYVDTGDAFQADPTQFLEALDHPSSGVGIHVSPWGDTGDVAILKSVKKPILHDRCLAALDQKPFSFTSSDDAAVYSFGWGKPLGYLHGGVLCGNSAQQLAVWKKWQKHKITRSPSRLSHFTDSLLLTVGLNPLVFPITLKLQESEALLRLSGRDSESSSAEPKDACDRPSGFQLERLLEKIQNAFPYQNERRLQVEAYFSGLEGVKGILLPPKSLTLSHFPIRVEGRLALKTYLQSQGVFSSDRLFSTLLNQFPHLREKNQFEPANAQKLTQTTLHLPLYAGLDVSEIHAITNKIRGYYV